MSPPVEHKVICLSVFLSISPGCINIPLNGSGLNGAGLGFTLVHDFPLECFSYSIEEEKITFEESVKSNTASIIVKPDICLGRCEQYWWRKIIWKNLRFNAKLVVFVFVFVFV